MRINWGFENAMLAMLEAEDDLQRIQDTHRDGLLRGQLPTVLNQLQQRAVAAMLEIGKIRHLPPGAELGVHLRLSRVLSSAKNFVRDRALG